MAEVVGGASINVHGGEGGTVVGEECRGSEGGSVGESG